MMPEETLAKSPLLAVPEQAPPAEVNTARLPLELWNAIQASVPVVCVDIVPVRKRGGMVLEVGFIRRDAPFFSASQVWCHVGGRMNLGETVRQAVVRHVSETLGVPDVELGENPQPDYVQQYFTTERPDLAFGVGLDPRKHAVALTFVIEVPDSAHAVEGGEGLEFTWFPLGALPGADETWPGSLDAVRSAIASHERS